MTRKVPTKIYTSEFARFVKIDETNQFELKADQFQNHWWYIIWSYCSRRLCDHISFFFNLNDLLSEHCVDFCKRKPKCFNLTSILLKMSAFNFYSSTMEIQSLSKILHHFRIKRHYATLLSRSTLHLDLLIALMRNLGRNFFSLIVHNMEI